MGMCLDAYRMPCLLSIETGCFGVIERTVKILYNKAIAVNRVS